MRKLILIAVIAMMSSTSCYANLSLASNDLNPPAVAQPSDQAPAAGPVTAAKTSTVAKPPRRRPSGIVAAPTRPVRSQGYAHCL